MTPQQGPLGPKGRLLTGSLPEYRRDRLAFLTRRARDYGDFVPYRLGPRRIVLLSDPDLIKEVLATKTHRFQKTFYLRMNRLTFGDGLLTSEGDFWRHQRRLSQPAFHHDRINAGAVMLAAKAFFGTNQMSFSVFNTSSNVTREYDRVTDRLKDTIDARIYLGIHFRTADVQAVVLGKRVARWVSTHAFQQVD
jgi:hypothetical protein